MVKEKGHILHLVTDESKGTYIGNYASFNTKDPYLNPLHLLGLGSLLPTVHHMYGFYKSLPVSA